MSYSASSDANKRQNRQPNQGKLNPPDQLLQMYRNRAGLTQAELAGLVGLSKRMILNWEAGSNLPRPETLKKLLEIYVTNKVFLKGQELAEAEVLWEAVKGLYEQRTSYNTLYPPFDKVWFELLRGQWAVTNRAGTAITPPGGIVTFLFTDIEGSSRLWEEHPQAMSTALEKHNTIVRKVLEEYGGYIFKTMGDGFWVAFATTLPALNAAITLQHRLLAPKGVLPLTGLKVRTALYTGAGEVKDGDYLGQPLNRLARIMAAGYGGQILVARTTYDLIRDNLPVGVALLDLGEHHLKDLSRPEHLFQVMAPGLPTEFEALKTVPVQGHNLPQPLSSFIGREAEIASLKKQLVENRQRLLTLVGAGGCGKTRLSLKVAAEVIASFGDGVWLVELAPLLDPRLIAQTIATVLGLTEQAGQPILDSLHAYLRSRQLLLVLDNCEHLVPECAKVVEALLEAAPGLQILASSREAFGISGETTFRVPSLRLPDQHTQPALEKLAGYEAVRLFVERSGAVSPSFSLTRQNAPALVQLCQQLDGIPLALELAAARTNLLTIEQINSRLADRFRLLTAGNRTALPRQQTLRALVDWSYELLSEGEKRLFSQLSVFVGGWTLAAAEAVCVSTVDAAQGLAEYGVLEALGGLVNKSLVQVEEQPDGVERRYYFLETLRQYAGEKLRDGGGEQTVQTGHLAYYAGLVGNLDINSRLFGSEFVVVLKWLDRELANLRAAFDYGLATGQTEPVLAFVYHLIFYWDVRCYFTEGRHYSEQTIAATVASGLGRAKAFYAICCAGWMSLREGDRTAAQLYLEEAYELSKDHPDKEFVVYALTGIGHLYWSWGKYSAARRFYEQALVVIEASQLLDHPFFKPATMGNVAITLEGEGDYAQASRLEDAILVLARESGNSWILSVNLCQRGRLAVALGDYAEARLLFEETLTISQENGFTNFKAHSLSWLGIVAYHEDKFKEANSYLAECLDLSLHSGQRFTPLETLVAVAGLLSKCGKQPEQAELLKPSATLIGTIAVATTAGQQLLNPITRRYYEQAMAEVRTGLDDASFEEAFAKGQAMSIEAAFTYVRPVL